MSLMLVLLFAFHQEVFCVNWVHAEAPFVYSTRGQLGYTYIPGDRREPFKSMLVEPGPSVISKAVMSDTLHSIKASWNILGILSGLRGKKAMLQNTKGQRYMVSVGDMLGEEKIRVIHLTDTTVTLEYNSNEKTGPQYDKSKTVELTFVWQ